MGMMPPGELIAPLFLSHVVSRDVQVALQVSRDRPCRSRLPVCLARHLLASALLVSLAVRRVCPSLHLLASAVLRLGKCYSSQAVDLD